ncbi:hypothetical protein BG015_004254 [Linnemannia schmuckeri]|uniref:Uncharacterized protein n=1 Tax=Linnemannia schmuckeri TaxID=64567 RepID=A0A9P5RDB8_9FUNG|nr:hypothetical protein BG015_004254 [Linnemannia schmuckeri]
MSPIISKNKYSILSDNGNTNATSTVNTTTDARQTVTVYPQSSNESNDDYRNNNNLTLTNDNSEDDGEWIVKASVKRQPRRRPSHQNNTINEDNEDRSYSIEDDSEDEDGYMSWTEHELSKHVKATQLKNIRTHPGVPLAVRRSMK